MENFRRFAPSEALFCPIFWKKRKIFGAPRHLNYVMKIFNGTGMKNREEIGKFWFQVGEKIGTFGQNIYPWALRSYKLRSYKKTCSMKIKNSMYESLRARIQRCAQYWSKIHISTYETISNPLSLTRSIVLKDRKTFSVRYLWILKNMYNSKRGFTWNVGNIYYGVKI